MTEEHKTYAKAGNAQSRHLTPFKQTCMILRKAVEESPGMPLKDFVENYDTHYSSKQSAKGSLAKWIDRGKVKGIRIEREGGIIHLYPDGS